MSRFFPAKYASNCGICDDTIYPDDMIAIVDDRSVHQACAPDGRTDVDPLAVRGGLCELCFCYHDPAQECQ